MNIETHYRQVFPAASLQWIRFFILTYVSACASVATFAAEANLNLTNPGFEEGWNGWTVTPAGGGMAELSMADKRSGSYSLKITDDSSEHACVAASGFFPSQEGIRYRVRFWANRISGVGAGSGFSVYLQFFDGLDRQLGQKAQSVSLASGWRQYALEDVAPPETAKVRVTMQSWSANTVTVHVDDVEISEDPLGNPGFELETNGVLLGWRSIGSPGMASVREDAARTGSRGLRVEDGSTAQAGGLDSLPIQVTADCKYVLSFWSRIVSGGGFTVRLMFLDAAGSHLQGLDQAINLPNIMFDWRPLSIEAVAPEGAATVKIRMSSWTNSVVTVDLDDFEFGRDPLHLQNPGFEESDGLPLAWNTFLPVGGPGVGWAVNDNKTRVIESAARMGNYGVEVRDQNSVAVSRFFSNAVPVVPEERCILRFWVKREEGSGMGIRLRFYNAQDVLVEEKQLGITSWEPAGPQGGWAPANRWVERSFEARTPAGARTARVWLQSGSAQMVTLQLDDFTLIRAKGPSDQRISQIAAFLDETPEGVGRTIDDVEAWAALPGSLRTEFASKGNQRLADHSGENFPELSDETYLQCHGTGNRAIYDTPNSNRLAILTDLTLAQCVQGPNGNTYLAAIEDALKKILDETSWTLPAHDPALDAFNREYMLVDLAASKKAWILATVDHLLGNRLAAATRQKIRNEVQRRVLAPTKDLITGLVSRGRPWHRDMSNWNAVCHAGVIGAALALEADRNERAWFLAAMEMYIPNYLAGISPDGYCVEGLSYWNYGFGHYVMLAEAVLQATGGQINLYNAQTEPPRIAHNREIIRRALLYPRRLEMLPGIYPAFSDSDPKEKPADWIFRIAGKRMADLGYHVVQNHGRPLVTDAKWPLFQGAIMMFADMPPASVDSAFTVPLSRRDKFEYAGVVVCRHNPGASDGFALAFKTGHNDELHNHNDIGSYVVASKGDTPLVDPGAEIYTARTFGTRRYQSKVINSYGHSVPVLEDVTSQAMLNYSGTVAMAGLQEAGVHARGTIVSSQESESEDSYTINLTEAYKAGTPTLASLTRKLKFTRTGTGRGIEISDEVVFGGSSNARLGTSLITLGNWEAAGATERRVADGQGIEQVRVRVTHSGGNFIFREDEFDRDWPGAVFWTESQREEWHENLPNARIVRRLLILRSSGGSGKIVYKITPSN